MAQATLAFKLSYHQLATIKTTIIFFVCPFKCLNKHCFYFLLGNWKQCISKILERQTKSIMVFLIVANLIYNLLQI